MKINQALPVLVLLASLFPGAVRAEILQFTGEYEERCGFLCVTSTFECEYKEQYTLFSPKPYWFTFSKKCPRTVEFNHTTNELTIVHD